MRVYSVMELGENATILSAKFWPDPKERRDPYWVAWTKEADAVLAILFAVGAIVCATLGGCG